MIMKKYIDVEKALEYIEEQSQNHPCFRTDFEGMYFFVRDELPKAERPGGAWIYKDFLPQCNICGSFQTKISPFCPMCGTKMNMEVVE